MKRDRATQTDFLDFYLPFSGNLNGQNRWVILSKLIDWDLVQRCYDPRISETQGAPSLSSRMAFAALLLKDKLGLTDRETVETISENPYLQYFIGLVEFRSEAPFDPSMMVHFRKRFSESALQKINESIAGTSPNTEAPVEGELAEKEDSEAETPEECALQSSSKEDQNNKGSLLIDATCIPSDITYPTDLKLLNQAREKTEQMIDVLFEPLIEQFVNLALIETRLVNVI